MPNPKHVILVEGEADRQVLECLCQLIGIDPKITVFTPTGLSLLETLGRDVDGIQSESQTKIKDTKQGVYNLLSRLLPSLEDGQLERLAIIVDADQTGSNSGGFDETLRQLQEKLAPYERANSEQGLLFRHPQGGYPIGVWIMPNNQDDGMIETWLSGCIHPDESSIFKYAAQATQQVEPQKFTEQRRIKAEIATWLAWQKKPSIGLYAAFWRDKKKTLQLIDDQAPHYQALTAWLKQVFVEDSSSE